MKKFQTIDVKKLNIRPFDLIQKGMLITVNNSGRTNAMTASWGGLGVLWHKDVAFTFVRPQRYTFELLQQNDHYSLCFLSPENGSILDFCGKNSGRDTDKIAETGLVPINEGAYTYFEQADLVLLCKKLYTQFIDPKCFTVSQMSGEHYPQNDYHKVYVGEVQQALLAT